MSAQLRNVYNDLRKQIKSGAYAKGALLPKVHELAEHYQCSVNLASKAISQLVQEGLVEQKKRLGTRVIVDQKSLLADKTQSFAFIYPSQKHEGIRRTLMGFEEAAAEEGSRVLTLMTGFNQQQDREFIRRLVEFGVRGAAIIPNVSSPESLMELANQIDSSEYPVVIVGNYVPGLRCSAVYFDGFDAGYTMTRYLLDKGLKKVGYFSNQASSMLANDIYKGYCRALKEKNLPLVSELVFNEMMCHPSDEAPTAEPTQLAKKYLKSVKGIDGVVCMEDYLAIGIIEAAKDLGIKVPKQLKVTGIADLEVARRHQPALTSFNTQPELSGREAYKVLRQLSSESAPVRRDVPIAGNIVIRESA